MGLEIIGAGLNYKASKKAANAQQEGAAQASAVAKDTADRQLELQREIWEKQQKDQQPYQEQGAWGINTLGNLMKSGAGQLNNPLDLYLKSKGLSGGQFNTNNPAYQFQLKQGQQALDRSSAARGMGYSGAQMKAAQDYGQGMASTEFGNYYNRLAGLSQGGQQAAGSMAQAGGQYANNASTTFGNL